MVIRTITVCALVCLYFGAAFAQTNTTSTAVLNGVVAGQLSPGALPGGIVTSTCSSGGNTWTYEVVARDSAGGAAPFTGTQSVSTTCAALSPANYNKIAVPFVPGAASCDVYRSVPGTYTTGKIGTVPCGTTLQDLGLTGDGTSAPSNNTTGIVQAASGGVLQLGGDTGISRDSSLGGGVFDFGNGSANNTQGTVVAQAFNAKGAGAGTEILSAGMPLSTCGTPPLCIVSTGEFFQEAASSISTSWGVQWPNSLPTSANTYLGPFLFGPAPGGSPNNASPVTIGNLSNPNNNELMSATGSFSTNDVLIADTNSNAIDSTVAIFNAGSGTGSNYLFLPIITYPTNIGSNQVIETTPNQVRVVQFVVPYKIVIGHFSVDVTTASSTKTFNIGIYSNSGSKLIDSGAMSCSSATIVTASFTQVTLQPGVYYEAVAGNDTACGLDGLAGSTTLAQIFNAVPTSLRVGTATGTLSSGVLPSTLGAITGGSTPAFYVLAEP